MPNGLAARNGGRAGIAALVAILLLGLGLRVGEAWDGRAPVFDATAYAAIARNLDEGSGFTVGASATQPSSDYSPGLPLFVAGLYKLTGGVHERLARLVLAVIGTLAVLFTYLLARRMGVAVLGSPRGDQGHEPPARRGSEGDKGRAVEGWAVVGALIAALAVAVYPATIEYSGMLMTEPLAATLLAGAVLALLWAGDARGAEGGGTARTRVPGARGYWRWLVPGLTLGVLALVRPEYLLIGLGLALLVFLREHFAPRPAAHPRSSAADNPDRDRKAEHPGDDPGRHEPGRPTEDPGGREEGRPAEDRGRRGSERHGAPWVSRRGLFSAAVVVLGIVVVVAPWTVRNAIALDRFVAVSTGGGQVLFAGTYLPSDGNPEEVGSHLVEEHPTLFGPHAAERLRLEQILARYGEHVHPGMEPEKALSELGKAQLEDDVLHHTGEYVGFVATKIGRIWSHGPRAIMRTPVWEALHWTLLVLGLLGLGLLAYLRRWEALLVGAIFLAVTVISALLVASPRRVLVLIPLLAACAGAAVAWLATAARRGTVSRSRSAP